MMGAECRDILPLFSLHPTIKNNKSQPKGLSRRNKGCYAEFQLSHFGVFQLSHQGVRSELVFRNVGIALFSQGMPGDHLSSAFNRQIRSFQLRPDLALDVLVRNPVIMPIIGNRRGLQDAPRLFMDEDKLQVFAGQAPERFRIEVSRTLLIDPFMFMAEVIILQPSSKGFIDLPKRCSMHVLHHEVPLDELE